MALQYDDTHFSENMPLDKAVKELNKRLEERLPVQALHIGTNEKLNEIKKKADLSKRLDELQSRIDDIEKPTKSELIYEPTKEEVDKFKKVTQHVALR